MLSCSPSTLMLPCRYYEDVADLDISAIINHHARMEDIDVNALAAQIDSEQLNGMAFLPSPPSKKKAADRCAWCMMHCCSCMRSCPAGHLVIRALPCLVQTPCASSVLKEATAFTRTPA